METFRFVLSILAIVLLVIGMINRKKNWGQKLLYFALGMLVMYVFTYGLEDIAQGLKAAMDSR